MESSSMRPHPEIPPQARAAGTRESQGQVNPMLGFITNNDAILRGEGVPQARYTISIASQPNSEGVFVLSITGTTADGQSVDQGILDGMQAQFQAALNSLEDGGQRMAGMEITKSTIPVIRPPQRPAAGQSGSGSGTVI